MSTSVRWVRVKFNNQQLFTLRCYTYLQEQRKAVSYPREIDALRTGTLIQVAAERHAGTQAIGHERTILTTTLLAPICGVD